MERFGEPTWRRLVEAVKDKVGGNNPALAQKIARDHPGMQPYTGAGDHPCTPGIPGVQG